MGNPFAEPKHPCPYFTDKLHLAEQILSEQLRGNEGYENLQIRNALLNDMRRAKTMKQLDIPLSAYDNCQNDVEQFLDDNYKPTFDLKTFGD